MILLTQFQIHLSTLFLQLLNEIVRERYLMLVESYVHFFSPGFKYFCFGSYSMNLLERDVANRVMYDSSCPIQTLLIRQVLMKIVKEKWLLPLEVCMFFFCPIF